MSSLSRKLERNIERAKRIAPSTGKYPIHTHVDCPHCGVSIELAKLYVVQILTPGPAAQARVVKQGVICDQEGCHQPIFGDEDVSS